MRTGRRELIALTLGASVVPALGRRAAPAPDAIPVWPPAERFALWPGSPPGAPHPLPSASPEITGKPGEYRDIWMRGTAHPDVGVFRATQPDGRALLIIPGGGYNFVSLRNEGTDPAAIFASHGITCFVLNYRLPGDGWKNRADVPLADAQRAMRLIRANAARYGIDPGQVGVLGFSAGGHVAASLLTLRDNAAYAPIDAADRLSAVPAFGGLLYAVSNMDPGRSHGGSRANLLGPDPDHAVEARFATDRNISAATPPVFIVQAQDDTTVPVANGLDLFAAARNAGVKCEGHFLMQGGHGFGVRLPTDLPGSLWPELFVRWIGSLWPKQLR